MYTVVTLGKSNIRHVLGLTADAPLHIEKSRYSLLAGEDLNNETPERPSCSTLVRAEHDGTAPVIVAKVPTMRQVVVILGEDGSPCKRCLKAAEREEVTERAFHTIRARRSRDEVRAVAQAVEKVAYAGDLWAAGAAAFAFWLMEGGGLEIDWDRGAVAPELAEVIAAVTSQLAASPGGNPTVEHPDV